MKVVIISRTLYPKFAPRSMRTSSLAIELSKQGHNVTVYAVLGKYDYTNFEKKHDIIVKNLGPTKWSKINSDEKSVPPTFFEKVISKILKKPLEFPDIELMFKTNKVLKEESNIDLLVTIAIPFPIHWGAALFKSKHKDRFPKTWIADCGDPYMGNRFNKHPFYFKYVEKWFCRKVDFLTIPIKEAKEGYYKEFHNKIRVIPQGFNFDEVKIDMKVNDNSVVTFIYAGVFYEGIRDPRPFLDYLSKLSIDFKFIVFTKSKSLIENYKRILRRKLEIRDYIPRAE